MQTSVGAGVTNLLRMARHECRAILAFIAIAEDGPEAGLATFPVTGAGEVVPADVLDTLVRQTWFDPELDHGGAFVRRATLDPAQTLMLAVAPLAGDASPGGVQGLLGVVGPEGRSFAQQQLDYLERVAWRLTRHLRARHELHEPPSRSRSTPPEVQTRPVPAPQGASGAPGPVPGPAMGAARVLHSTPPEPWVVAEPLHPRPSGPLAPSAWPERPGPVDPSAHDEAARDPGSLTRAVAEPSGPQAGPAPPGAGATGVNGHPTAPATATATGPSAPGTSGSGPNGYGGQPAGVPSPAAYRAGPGIPAERRFDPWGGPGRHGEVATATPPVVSGLRLGSEHDRPAPGELRPRTHVATSAPPWSPCWYEPDADAGLPGLGSFFSRAGRLLAADAGPPADVAVVAVALGQPGSAADLRRAVRLAGGALRRQLRHQDPLARVAEAAFATVVTLFPEGAKPEYIERRLAGAVRDAISGEGWADVRTATVVVGTGDGREADELVAEALETLGASPVPGRPA